MSKKAICYEPVENFRRFTRYLYRLTHDRHPDGCRRRAKNEDRSITSQ